MVGCTSEVGHAPLPTPGLKFLRSERCCIAGHNGVRVAEVSTSSSVVDLVEVDVCRDIWRKEPASWIPGN